MTCKLLNHLLTICKNLSKLTSHSFSVSFSVKWDVYIYVYIYIFSCVNSVPLSCLTVTPKSVASLSITNYQSLYPNSCPLNLWCHLNHLILCHPLLLPPSIFPSIRVFPNESVLHIRWAKYWSFNFNISPSNEYSGMISFRMDWLDLLVIQGTLKSLLQHHSSKASVLQGAQLSLQSNSHIHTWPLEKP